MQLIHFDCVNGFLNSIKEIIWQTEPETEAIYRCPLKQCKFTTMLYHICTFDNYYLKQSKNCLFISFCNKMPKSSEG